MLDCPDNILEIYLARGGEVDPCRPLIQGDVFAGVAIPGVGVEHDAAMLIEHPCSMRHGPVFKPRLEMIPVISHAPVPLGQWGTGHFRVFLLPSLDPAQPDQWFAASFEEVGMVPLATLKAADRLACLSERGILLLQQRHIFSKARTKVETSTLRDHQAHVFEEVELLEDWSRALVPIRVVAGDDFGDALEAEAAEFDAYLNSSGATGDSLRQLLHVEHQRASVRRQVRREMATRAEASALDRPDGAEAAEVGLAGGESDEAGDDA